jgi:hypothetical protein
MDRYRVHYNSLLGMSEDNSPSQSQTSSKNTRNVNFPPETTTDGIPSCMLEDPGGRRGSKFFQRPRSLSVWSTSSIISRNSNRFDDR